MSEHRACSSGSLVFNAPLCGALPAGAIVVHAVDVEHVLGFTRDGATSRCGAEGLYPVPLRSTTPDGDVLVPLRWLPRTASLPPGVTVCPDCRRPSERPRDRTPHLDMDL